MKFLALLLVLGLIASAPACKSESTTTSKAPTASQPTTASKAPAKSTVPCTCGTPEAQIEGCANPICLSGKTNPDNPNCVCGNLTIPPANKK